MSTALVNSHEIKYEEYLALPEIMQRYEIIDGEMIMSPAPTSGHQFSIEAETVEVLQLTPKSIKRAGLYGIGDVVRSQVLPGLELPTRKLFA